MVLIVFHSSRNHNIPHINYDWSYFGFRPGIHDIKKLKTLDTFNDNVDEFELEFAKRFSEKFKSFLHSNRITYHIGNEKSSYEMNNSIR